MASERRRHVIGFVLAFISWSESPDGRRRTGGSTGGSYPSDRGDPGDGGGERGARAAAAARGGRGRRVGCRSDGCVRRRRVAAVVMAMCASLPPAPSTAVATGGARQLFGGGGGGGGAPFGYALDGRSTRGPFDRSALLVSSAARRLLPYGTRPCGAPVAAAAATDEISPLEETGKPIGHGAFGVVWLAPGAVLY